MSNNDKTTTLAQLRQLNRELVEDKACTLNEYIAIMLREYDKVEDPQLLAEMEIGLGCKYFFSGEPILAFQYLVKGQKMYDVLPKEAQDLWWLGTMYYSIAHTYTDTLDFEKALHHFLSCIEAFRESRDEEEMKTGMLFVGYTLLRLGAGDEAIKYIKRAADGSEKYPIVTARGYVFMGMAYYMVDDFEQAKQYYDKAFNATDNLHRKFSIIRQAIPCSLARGEVEEAEKQLAIANKIATKIELDGYRKITLFIMQAQVETAHQAYEQARSKCDKALVIAVETNNLLDQARIKLQQAHILFLEERFDVCQLLLENVSKMRLPSDILAEANKLLLNLYEITEQWKKAYRLLHEIRQTSLFTQSRLRSIEQLLDSKQHKQVLEEKNSELVALHTEKDELFQIVVHDLKNPLSVAQLNADLLMKRGSDYSPAKLKQLCSRIYNELRSSFKIIEQLTAMAQAESNESKLLLETFAIDELVARIVANNVPLATSKQQNLVVGELTSIKITADRLCVGQILSNLISNAIKYSHPDATTTVNLSILSSENHVCIEVKDEGLGFSKEDLSKAFAKYTKLSNVPTGDESSTGLGLYIVKTLATKIGGTVSVTSEGKGKGSVFTVKFPTVVEQSVVK